MLKLASNPILRHCCTKPSSNSNYKKLYTDHLSYAVRCLLIRQIFGTIWKILFCTRFITYAFCLL